MNALERFIGGVCIFSGTFWFVVSATAAGMIVVNGAARERRMLTAFAQKIEIGFLSSLELKICFAFALLAWAAYALGNALMPGDLRFVGRVLTTMGLLWWLLTGLCYVTLYAAETEPVPIVAFLINSLGAFLMAIGQTIRQRPTDAPI